jgi:hypothetical protein
MLQLFDIPIWSSFTQIWQRLTHLSITVSACDSIRTCSHVFHKCIFEVDANYTCLPWCFWFMHKHFVAYDVLNPMTSHIPRIHKILTFWFLSVHHYPNWNSCKMWLCTRHKQKWLVAPSCWQRIVPGFMCQTGDPTCTGKGGFSIYGPVFADEISARQSHDRKGIVSMANSGRNTNSSQFFITLNPVSYHNSGDRRCAPLSRF